MTQIALAGPGGPIPTIALSDPNLSDERPTVELVLENGVPFQKADYVNLGYTHYEVWCVGGAGGLGAFPGTKFEWPVSITEEIMPPAVFTAWKEMLVYDGHTSRTNYYQPGRWVPYPPGPGDPMPPYAWKESAERYGEWWLGEPYYLTFDQYVEQNNPTHKGYVRNYLPPILIPDENKFGGGGGGGGTHVVAGLLSDLPDDVPVIVGVAGTDAPPGQVMSPATLTPVPNEPTYRGFGYLEGSYNNPATWDPIFRAWQDRYPGAHPSFDPPSPGQDGQASSFGDFAKASGGKGGGPAATWAGSTLNYTGNGGTGGIGDSDVAGGGGAGAIAAESGKDGMWNGSIGGGGGGGRGGQGTVGGSGGAAIFGGPSFTITRQPTNGGRGAFSYTDTTVYGAGQFKNYLTPGGGGGVRANRKRQVGSDAAGYSPDGMVLIRLTKIE